MNRLAPYVSSNGHTVREYGRLFFIVSSASRAGMVHFVDFEIATEEAKVATAENWRRFVRIAPRCTCEDKKYRGGICRHCWAALEMIADKEITQTVPQTQRPQRTRRQYTLEPARSFKQ